MLPSINHVAGNTFVFQQDSAASHRARTPLNIYSKMVGWGFDGTFNTEWVISRLNLQHETPDFIGPDL